MEKTEQVVLHTYNRFPVVFDHGQGVHLYDVDGKEYLDFGAGIAVFALGYGNEAYNQALKDQIDKIIHTSNLFYHRPLMEAAQKVIAHTGLSKVFFTNSGTEAIEGAIKAARKYAYLRDGHADHEIIAMEHSFHGRTVGALSVTGNAHYQEPFKPLMGGVRFAKFNDLDSVRACVTDRTCAIILETVQGEGGIHPADPAFLKGLRTLCDEKDILLILDEIQCGMGRTGYWFACDAYGVRPDIMTCAKALGCGVPVGAFVLGEVIMGQPTAETRLHVQQYRRCSICLRSWILSDMSVRQHPIWRSDWMRLPRGMTLSSTAGEWASCRDSSCHRIIRSVRSSGGHLIWGLSSCQQEAM